ncbi:MAG: zinc ribbon domain-containing protein [Ruminococcaceae bacterium]|nr:zinc ribbon domain-containing protein [Oscillospiraceae bacterium]
MVCYNCGKNLDVDDKFCYECGTKNIVTEEELAIDKEISNKSKKEKKPLKNPKKTATVALILSAASLFLPVAVGLVLSIIALVSAARVKKETDDEGVLKTRKLAKILGIIGLVYSCLATAAVALAILAWLVSVGLTVLGSVLVVVASFVFPEIGDGIFDALESLIGSLADILESLGFYL